MTEELEVLTIVAGRLEAFYGHEFHSVEREKILVRPGRSSPRRVDEVSPGELGMTSRWC